MSFFLAGTTCPNLVALFHRVVSWSTLSFLTLRWSLLATSQRGCSCFCKRGHLFS